MTVVNSKIQKRMEYGIKEMGYGWEMDRVNKSWCGGEEARGWGGVGRKQRLHATL